VRGVLLFQDASDTSNSPVLSGSSGMACGGSLYFHTTNYADLLTLSGGSGKFAGVCGSIAVDNLSVTGGSTIPMLPRGRHAVGQGHDGAVVPALRRVSLIIQVEHPKDG
jgi:hypothetical protein